MTQGINEDFFKFLKSYVSSTPEIILEGKILVVDDSRFQRSVLVDMFRNLGLRYIEEAENGKVALQKTQSFQPDLVSLDLEMPDMNGYDYCKMVRGNPKHDDMVILVQTILNDAYIKIKIFKAGANDYIAKPIDYNELAIRCFMHLERLMYIRKLENFQSRVQAELTSAKQLLKATLPRLEAFESVRKQYRMDVASEFKSSHEMGGDFWGMEPLSENELGIYSIDFSGHGLDSALNVLRLHSIIGTREKRVKDPARLLHWLNNMLLDVLPVGSYATMFYGIIDTKDKTLNYASAAAPSPFFIEKNTATCKPLESHGFPLAVLPNASYTSHSIAFQPGDMLILYSDALTEVTTPKGTLLGEEGVIKMLNALLKHKEVSSEWLLKAFLKDFYQGYGKKLADDLTLNIFHLLQR